MTSTFTLVCDVSQTSLNCRKLEEETTIELFTNWLFRDNSSYVEQLIYDNRFEVMIQCVYKKSIFIVFRWYNEYTFF